MKYIKKFFAYFLAILFVLSPFASLSAKAVEKPTEAFYVNDFSNVLPSDLVIYMTDVLSEIYDETGAQAVFTTIDYTGAKDINDYALEMYNEYKIGSKEGEGVLFLFVIKEDNYTLLPGIGFEDVFTADIAYDIFDTIDPYFNEGNYQDAVYNAFLETVEILEKKYNFSIVLDPALRNQQGENIEIHEETKTSEKSGSIFAILMAILIIVSFIFIFSGMRSIGGYRRRRFFPFFGRRRYYPRRPWFFPSRRYYPPDTRNSTSTKTPNKPQTPNTMNKKPSSHSGGGGSSRGGGFTRNSRTSSPSNRKTGSSWTSSSRGSSWSGSSSRGSGSSGSSSGGGGSSRGGGFTRK